MRAKSVFTLAIASLFLLTLMSAPPAAAGSACIDRAFGKGCYKDSSNRFRVADQRVDGFSVVLIYQFVGSPESNRVTDADGANNGFKFSRPLPGENDRVRFYICKADEGVAFDCTGYKRIRT